MQGWLPDGKFKTWRNASIHSTNAYVQGAVLAALWAMQTHQEFPGPGQPSSKGQQPPPPGGRITLGSTLDLSEPSYFFPGKMRVIMAATFCFVEKTERRHTKGLGLRLQQVL